LGEVRTGPSNTRASAVSGRRQSPTSKPTRPHHPPRAIPRVHRTAARASLPSFSARSCTYQTSKSKTKSLDHEHLLRPSENSDHSRLPTIYTINHEHSFLQENTEDQPLLLLLASVISVGRDSLSSLSVNTKFTYAIVVSSV